MNECESTLKIENSEASHEDSVVCLAEKYSHFGSIVNLIIDGTTDSMRKIVKASKSVGALKFF